MHLSALEARTVIVDARVYHPVWLVRLWVTVACGNDAIDWRKRNCSRSRQMEMDVVAAEC